MDIATRKLDPITSCFVPCCKNSVLMCPDKHFFYVPQSTRKQWCAAVNKPNVPKQALYICEDHLNLQDDLINYHDWLSKKVTRPRLKPQVPTTLKNIGNESASIVAVQDTLVATDQGQRTMEKSTLCIPECHSRHVQVKPIMISCSVSVNMRKLKSIQPLEVIEEEYSEECSVSLSTQGSTTEFSGTESSSGPSHMEKLHAGRNFMLNLIKKQPMAYIGVPKQYYWIIVHIGQEFKIPALHIIITLYKLRNNDTFSRIKDLFEISITTIWRTFYVTLKLLRQFFEQFLYWPKASDIKSNLPPVFTTNKEFANVQSVIDCFEIQIEKPIKPIDQSLTWSSYKTCNTIKYLIGATPDGFINFISEGYGGRIADINLVEQSGFLETVPENATILADRGFKHLEAHLTRKSVKVLRPPSVSKGTKMTKSEVIDSKVIASLRIHIERVIRRVRLFKLLKPHSVVNNKLITALDDAVIVACGLINLQSHIIKQ